jgi:hypothetical protein
VGTFTTSAGEEVALSKFLLPHVIGVGRLDVGYCDLFAKGDWLQSMDGHLMSSTGVVEAYVGIAVTTMIEESRERMNGQAKGLEARADQGKAIDRELNIFSVTAAVEMREQSNLANDLQQRLLGKIDVAVVFRTLSEEAEIVQLGSATRLYIIQVVFQAEKVLPFPRW